MIEKIEAVMQHWGEQRMRIGLRGGLSSPMAGIMEWGAYIPRRTPGSRALVGNGSGLDYISSEVEAAIAQLSRSPAKSRGPELAQLATLRYVESLPVREQMRLVGINEGADRTYRNWINKLHQQVLAILAERSASRSNNAGADKAAQG
ncbi:hypothetical protein ALQ93_00462 [Pseudomonas syringae pv. pisi]|uniref:Uncharacterized protein n=1 Tax=Pseudomonas savastanoi pv. phaseolicola TaxID=319 RepID=A0A7Z6Y4X6_PSESH|nr:MULTISPECIES: hypothetical protein [Pseudomonas syringae group]PYD08671.1 hypothetical protein DND62_25995 [Pseudomonas syringae pv. pisi]PYD30587.1 hypothetical protein DND58_15285 [Pseudomonas syringae pv. pisi]RML51576.1 hypothetical protein ALQ93_00462 [Pseudomonas syringae pv. pisi]RML63151.1 hypothetical protein ALQ92_01646 [Pseudomonas syringae pv. pisi]RMU83391.1 hypothetical protein ALP21_01412 [Pseudomonas savastanoi pv. phaseolicola]